MVKVIRKVAEGLWAYKWSGYKKSPIGYKKARVPTVIEYQNEKKEGAYIPPRVKRLLVFLGISRN